MRGTEGDGGSGSSLSNTQALEGIKSNAPKQQDNVLVEYPNLIVISSS